MAAGITFGPPFDFFKVCADQPNDHAPFAPFRGALAQDQGKTISARLSVTPGKRKALTKSKVHQLSRSHGCV